MKRANQMTVIELIEALRECCPTAKVIVNDSSREGGLDHAIAPQSVKVTANFEVRETGEDAVFIGSVRDVGRYS
jgi:hypothetical protein